ncbi:MAG: J domain-containing protein [Patescibacteria group bacterium]
MNMGSIDHYKVLGVPEDATTKEIKRAYKSIVRENHPDVCPKDLPREEIAQREERVRAANIAYEILADPANPQKRREYDLELARQRRPGEGQLRRRAGVSEQSGQSGSDFFTQIINDLILGGLPDRKETSDGFILLPLNDWGLLAALRMAYQSREDGEWKVRKSDRDDRGWMPELIYRVRRTNGQVYVFRKVTDWRPEGDRDKPIETYKAGWRRDIDKPTVFLGEQYFGGKLTASGVLVPAGYKVYLGALKDLARKIAEDKNSGEPYEVASECDTIRRYAPSRENRCQVAFVNFWEELRRVGALVVREGPVKSVESQRERGGAEGE